MGKSLFPRGWAAAGAQAAARVLIAGLAAGGTMVGVADPAAADPHTAPPDAGPTGGISLETFAAADFTAQASGLPPELHDAVERDLGVPAEQYLAEAAAGQSASNVVEALRARGVGIDAAVFVRQSQTLQVIPADDADRAAIEATGAVVAGTPPPDAKPGATIVPHAEFKGGYGYGQPGDDGQFASYCTAGFTGYGADGSPVVLSAGHCFPDATDETPWAYIDIDEPWTADAPGWPAPGATLGVGVGGDWRFGESHDAGLLRLDETAWSPVPAVSTWGGGDGDPRGGEIVVTDHIAPVMGQPVCRSGVTSGYQCGEILAVDREVDYGEAYGNAIVTGFFSSACSAPGDSGGPFLSGTAAVGVLSGAGGPESGRCEDWDTETDVSFGYPLSGGDNSAEALYDDGEWELAVAIATPEVSSPRDGAEVGPTPVISGRVPYAGRHHTVTVVIDGRTYSAAVEAGGRFSVEIADSLTAGSAYSSEVQAHYGRYSHSESVTGRFSVAAPEAAGGRELLPATGSPTTPLALAGLALLAGGATAVYRPGFRPR